MVCNFLLELFVDLYLTFVIYLLECWPLIVVSSYVLVFL